MASIASSSVSTTRSAKPVTSACSRQPPSSSGSTSSLIASEASSALETARTAPLRMTQKSESTEYQDDGAVGEARAWPTPRASRAWRWYCVGVVAQQRAHAARAHVVGHARAGGLAEEDERQAALRGHALHVRDLAAVGRAARGAHHGEVVGDDGDLAAVDAAEAGDLAVGRRTCRGPRAGFAEVAKRPDSMKVPGSNSRSRRSRALSTFAAARRASRSGPPMRGRPPRGARIPRSRRARRSSRGSAGVAAVSAEVLMGAVAALASARGLAQPITPCACSVSICSAAQAEDFARGRGACPRRCRGRRGVTRPGVADRRGTTTAMATPSRSGSGARDDGAARRGSAGRRRCRRW